MTWEARAACAGTDPEAFFPEPGGRVRKAALDACWSCEVRAECLAFAMTDPLALRHGVWGGTTPPQRKRLNRRAPL